jgi:long-subunit fatty acid transport protein
LLSRSKFCAALIALGALSFPAAAQNAGGLGADRAIPPTPDPVGSGARAAGMSNAFIAIADDATAASWNPAGLVQLERPEIAIAGSLLSLRHDFSARSESGFGGDFEDDFADLNFLSFSAPLPRPIFERNATVSLSYQRRFDFNQSWRGRVSGASVLGLEPPLLLNQRTTLDFDQEGSLSTISPAFAIELTRQLSVGLALNLWRSSFLSDNGWKQSTQVNGVSLLGTTTSLSHGRSTEEYSDFSGENLTLGMLWKPTPRWSFGLRYDTAFTGTADYTARDRELRFRLGSTVPLLNANVVREKREIRFPDTLALGMAWRPNDRLTVALDVSRTDWNDLIVKDRQGRRFSLVDGTDRANALQRTDFDPTWAVRLGSEYVFIPREPGEDLPWLWTLRGGLSYEEEPASGRSDRNFFSKGNGEPDRFYGLSLGAGVLIGQRVNIDLAWQMRYGPGVNGDLNPGVEGFDDDELRHRLLLSTVVYF